MGARFSRAASLNAESQQGTELQNLNSTGTVMESNAFYESGLYFGPRFLLDYANYVNFDAATLRSELTRIFWEELWTILTSGGVMSETQLQQLGNVYSQQSATASVKSTTTLVSQVNLHKNSIKLIRSRQQANNFSPLSSNSCSSTDKYTISFDFSSNLPCQIHLFWNASESFEWEGLKAKDLKFYVDEESIQNKTVFGPFGAGCNQKFELPDEYMFYPHEWITEESDIIDHIEFLQDSSMASIPPKELDDVDVLPLPKPKHTYPLTIVLETISDSNQGSSISLLNSQSSFIKFIRKEDDAYGIKVMKQKIIIDNVPYILQDIYGLLDGNPLDSNNAGNDDKSMRECVICMSSPRDTIAIPCRHLCVCRDCADVLRVPQQAHVTSRPLPPKCPVCRQILTSLLQISLPKNYSRAVSKGSLVQKSAPMNENEDSSPRQVVEIEPEAHFENASLSR